MPQRRSAATRRPEYTRFDPAWFAPRTIEDVRRAVFARLRKGWPRKSSYDIEDAVSAGLVKLIDWWPEFPSTKKLLTEGDTLKTYTHAVYYAYGVALTAFELERDRNIRNPVDAMVDTADEAEQYIGTAWSERLNVHDGALSDEEREDAMLARLLHKHGVEGLSERVESLR